MGMSSDYISAINNNATHLRIGSEILEKETNYYYFGIFFN